MNWTYCGRFVTILALRRKNQLAHGREKLLAKIYSPAASGEFTDAQAPVARSNTDTDVPKTEHDI